MEDQAPTSFIKRIALSSKMNVCMYVCVYIYIYI